MIHRGEGAEKRRAKKGNLPETIVSASHEGRYNMAARYWDQVSDDATDLVKRMLVVHPHKRVTALKALNHPWISDFDESEKDKIEYCTRN